MLNHVSRQFKLLGWLSAIILLSSFYASAQGLGANIEINVRDANKSAIAGAKVVLRNSKTGFERSAVTDEAGRFVFRNLESADYEVTVLAEGFAREARETQNNSKLDFTLNPSSIVAETTVYSGSRQDELRESLNTKVEVLTEQQIRDTGYETVGETLREIPGVLTRRGSEGTTAGEQIQGIDSRQVLVLFDGFPSIGARGIKRGVLNLDRQSTANLQQIEVVKGASSALFGSDAIGGVINMIPREPSRPFEADLRFSGGNFGTYDGAGSFGFVKNNWGGFFTLEQHKRNDIDLTPTTFDTTIAGFKRTDFYARPQYKFSDKFKLTGLFDGYWNTARGRAVGEEGSQTNDVDEESQSYGLTADWTANDRTNVQLRGYFSRFDEITRGVLQNGSPIPDGNLFERIGLVDGTVSYVLGDRQLLQFGAEWRTNRLSGINRVRTASGERADTRNLWGQDKLSLTNWATLTVGLRYDNHSIFGSAVSPKIGLNIRVNENINLRASWGRGFRAPDLGQLYYRFLNPTSLYQVIGNPNLSPEHSGSWQIGGEYRGLNRRLRFGGNFFRNDVRNLIDSVSLGFVSSSAQLNALIAANGIDPTFNPVLFRLLFLYKNIANVYTQGVEFDGEALLPKGFAVSGAYTYLDARDKTTDLYLLSRNRHQGSVKFAYNNDQLGFRTNLRGSFYSNWIVSRTTAGVETVAPAFQLWDWYGAKSVKKGFEVFGAIDNLFDNQDPNTGRLSPTGTPLAINRAEFGRTFRLGLRWTFGKEK